MEKGPQLIFLGVCDKFKETLLASGRLEDGKTFPITMTNLLGLRYFYISYVYPLPIDFFYFVFAIDIADDFDQTYKINIIEEESMQEAGHMELNI
ncbi:hypothetical protein GF354_04765 [Candidatus Peregrinibacteria bacterium]|nr:hypothetical protein [Candidatus Peregrinibacteria bacterium]